VKKTSTRNRIVKAADQLFYQKGFENTSFADIAEQVAISRGNFYYHFKSKDRILEAVIARRLSDRNDMLTQWEREAVTPAGRIQCFIQILITNQTKIVQFGCPIGSLSSELAKLGHTRLAEANKLFDLFRLWLKQQFETLGHVAKANELALHLLARSQGIAVMANAFGDEEFIKREVNLACEWVQQLSQELEHPHNQPNETRSP
jgi:AcrR family transcriptional regulator